MRAFVTGSTGLLGSNLVRLLLQQGHHVRALARSPEKAARLFGGLDVDIVPGDMQNIAGFAAAMEGCDVLFHTAAYFREYYQPGNHWQTLEAINVRGTVDLLAEAERRGVSKVIYTSSSGVIGAPPAGSLADESTPPDKHTMANLYFKSKVLAEQEVDKFLKGHKLPVVLIQPGWMFGPYDAAPTSSGQIVLDLLQRKLPGIISGGASVTDARDVAQAMINAVERGRSGERYLLAGPYRSIAEICSMLERVSGVAGPKFRIPYPMALAVALVSETYSRLSGKPTLATVNGIRTLNMPTGFTSAKAIHELGATFRPLEETLRDEVTWYRSFKNTRTSDQLATQ